MTTLVKVTNLAVDYRVRSGSVRALDGVDLSIESEETLAIVGESGSGKTTLGLAVGRLLPPNATHIEGDLLLDGRSVFSYGRRELRDFRRDRLGFVFQIPTAVLDPTRRVGRQLQDVLDSRSDAKAAALELLERVGFADTKTVARSFPHELSGGMAQRVVVAIAIARNPSLIVADEPTASLDSSVRNQVLDVLFGLPAEVGAAILVLTHDLSAVASRCNKVAVMYAGRVVESGPRDTVLKMPRHPYTAGLLAATPGREAKGQQLAAIPGIPPVLQEPSTSCAYAPRCSLASAQCRSVRPEVREIDGRLVACHRAEQLRTSSGLNGMVGVNTK
jgi:peptide/nickel transport system ATP-binding protein